MLGLSLSHLRDAYAAELFNDGKSEGTITKWVSEINRFVAWAGETPLHEIKHTDIKFKFLAALEDEFHARRGRKMSPATRRGKIQALKSFYDFLDVNDYLENPDGSYFRNPMNKIRPPKLPEKPIDWLQGEEDRLLLREGPNQGRSSRTLRDKAVLYLYRYTGLRVDEGLSVKMNTINLTDEKPFLYPTRSKTINGLHRKIRIVPELLPVLVKWIEFTKQQGTWRPDGPFLVTRNGTEMHQQQVNTMLHRMAETAGVRDGEVSPQTLRRTFGSDLINRGVRLEVVSKLLGHASTAITEKAYAQLLDDTIRDEMLDAWMGWAA